MKKLFLKFSQSTDSKQCWPSKLSTTFSPADYSWWRQSLIITSRSRPNPIKFASGPALSFCWPAHLESCWWLGRVGDAIALYLGTPDRSRRRWWNPLHLLLLHLWRCHRCSGGASIASASIFYLPPSLFSSHLFPFFHFNPPLAPLVSFRALPQNTSRTWWHFRRGGIVIACCSLFKREYSWVKFNLLFKHSQSQPCIVLGAPWLEHLLYWMQLPAVHF